LPDPRAPKTARIRGGDFTDSAWWAKAIGARHQRHRVADRQFSWAQIRHSIGAACWASKYDSSGIWASGGMGGLQDVGFRVQGIQNVFNIVRNSYTGTATAGVSTSSCIS
jgi:hypothetical protein